MAGMNRRPSDVTKGTFLGFETLRDDPAGPGPEVETEHVKPCPFLDCEGGCPLAHRLKAPKADLQDSQRVGPEFEAVTVDNSLNYARDSLLRLSNAGKDKER